MYTLINLNTNIQFVSDCPITIRPPVQVVVTGAHQNFLKQTKTTNNYKPWLLSPTLLMKFG